jgi:hypothetical protein
MCRKKQQTCRQWWGQWSTMVDRLVTMTHSPHRRHRCASWHVEFITVTTVTTSPFTSSTLTMWRLSASTATACYHCHHSPHQSSKFPRPKNLQKTSDPLEMSAVATVIVVTVEWQRWWQWWQVVDTSCDKRVAVKHLQQLYPLKFPCWKVNSNLLTRSRWTNGLGKLSAWKAQGSLIERKHVWQTIFAKPRTDLRDWRLKTKPRGWSAFGLPTLTMKC